MQYAFSCRCYRLRRNILTMLRKATAVAGLVHSFNYCGLIYKATVMLTLYWIKMED